MSTRTRFAGRRALSLGVRMEDQLRDLPVEDLLAQRFVLSLGDVSTRGGRDCLITACSSCRVICEPRKARKEGTPVAREENPAHRSACAIGSDEIGVRHALHSDPKRSGERGDTRQVSRAQRERCGRRHATTRAAGSAMIGGRRARIARKLMGLHSSTRRFTLISRRRRLFYVA